MIYTEFLFNHVNVSSTVCCPGFQIPAYSYHLVNRKVCANKNKSFLCCSGPPLHNSGLCSCSVPWKTNSAVQLGSSRQQKGNFNPLPPLFFFLWHYSDLFGHKEWKSTPPSEKDWEVRRQIMPDPPNLQTWKHNGPGNESPNRSKCSTRRGV